MIKKEKPENKIILDLCGGTGSWSHPYRNAGYDVRNITLPNYDVRTYQPPENVYGILAAPPCTEFSFAKTNSKYPRKIKEGMEIVYFCLKIIWEAQYTLPTPLAKTTTLKFWALENPKGLLKRFLGKPVFEFNPYEFGDRYQKPTHLWGYFNIPKKSPVVLTKQELEKTGNSSRRLPILDGILKSNIQARRSITPPNFAKAFFFANK